jgi:hypothetical protein
VLVREAHILEPLQLGDALEIDARVSHWRFFHAGAAT